MNHVILKCMKSVFVLLIIAMNSGLHAVCGIRTLYRKSNKTTVHLVYDDHEFIEGVTVDEMFQLSYAQAKKKFYPAEQRFLTALERLDKHKHRVDLVWETYEEYIPPMAMFTGIAPGFIKKKFKNINFINGDKARNYFAGTFKTKPAYGFPRLKRYSYKNIVPLSSIQKKNIKERSGNAAWVDYELFYNNTLEAVHDYFESYYNNPSGVLDYERDLHNNDRWCALCDIEMLAHILASEKKKIIVFAGGWHYGSIIQFLLEHGFVELHIKGTRFFDSEAGKDEIRAMDALDDGCKN